MKMRGIGGEPTTGMLILIDGHPQYMGLMGHPIADAYQSMIAERVEVVRGPASMLYGSNAMGGVINILTAECWEDGVSSNLNLGYGSYNTLTSELSGRLRKNRLTAQVVGSYNRSDGHRPDMEFEQYGGYAKVGYELSKRWNISGDLNITHYNASNPGEISNPIYDNDSRITRGVTSLSLENSYDRTSGALKLYYNWGHHNIDYGYYEGEEPLDYLYDSNDLMVGVTWFQSTSLFKGNRVTAGVDYQLFGGEAWSIYNDGTETLTSDNHEDEIAGYLDVRQSLGGVLTLNAGLRIDHHSITGTTLIPQFGASLYPTPRGEVKLIASKGFRNPTIKELYMFTSQNPDLQPEELWSYEVAWRERLLNNRLTYEVVGYYINGANMIQVEMVDGRPINSNTGEIENWGVEFSTSYRVSPLLNLTANYSYLNMRYKVIAAPEHKLYAGVDLMKRRWGASVGVQYIDGLYTSVTEGSVATESFALLNIRANYKIAKRLDLYVKGENLLNQSYEINAGFPMPNATVMCGIQLLID